MSQASIIREVKDERIRQDAKWGPPRQAPFVRNTILMEEVGEVAEATLDMFHDRIEATRIAYRTELIQVAAVAIASIEALDANEFKW